MSETQQKIKDAEVALLAYKRECLAALLNQCLPDQQEVFYKMYPSVGKIPESKITWAIVQCENTIRNNKKKEDSI